MIPVMCVLSNVMLNVIRAYPVTSKVRDEMATSGVQHRNEAREFIGPGADAMREVHPAITTEVLALYPTTWLDSSASENTGKASHKKACDTRSDGPDLNPQPWSPQKPRHPSILQTPVPIKFTFCSRTITIIGHPVSWLMSHGPQ